MKAKKKFGQNFLINEQIIKNITDLVDSNENDLIIEIGPGKGALTKYLVQKDGYLKCIEIDDDMHKYLDFYNSDNCEIIFSDILKIDLEEISKGYNKIYVIGNLPYYITTSIIEYVTSNIKPSKMVFMVQKEVADRFTSMPGNKEYGYFTVYLNYYYEVKDEIFVGKNNFSPVPKVDSKVISFVPRNRNLNINEEEYFNFLKLAFSQKRKTLKNNLGVDKFNKILPTLLKYGFNENVRAEQINEEVFIEISKML